MNIADIIHSGKKVTNFEIDATGATALWPSDTEYKAECPADKRWYLIGGSFNRAVSSTLSVYLKEAGGKGLLYLASYSAATGVHSYPKEGSITPGHIIIIDAGEYISATFGTAQSATSYGSAIVIEVSV